MNLPYFDEVVVVGVAILALCLLFFLAVWEIRDLVTQFLS